MALLIAGCLAAPSRPAVAAPGELKAAAAARTVNPTNPPATIGHRVMRLFSNIYCDLRVQPMVLQAAVALARGTETRP